MPYNTTVTFRNRNKRTPCSSSLVNNCVLVSLHHNVPRLIVWIMMMHRLVLILGIRLLFAPLLAVLPFMRGFQPSDPVFFLVG